jgi:hypothetical protein
MNTVKGGATVAERAESSMPTEIDCRADMTLSAFPTFCGIHHEASSHLPWRQAARLVPSPSHVGLRVSRWPARGSSSMRVEAIDSSIASALVGVSVRVHLPCRGRSHAGRCGRQLDRLTQDERGDR